MPNRTIYLTNEQNARYDEAKKICEAVGVPVSKLCVDAVCAFAESAKETAAEITTLQVRLKSQK